MDMMGMRPEVLTLVVGLLASLALFRNIPKVTGIFRLLLVIGIAAQLGTHSVQFALAEGSSERQRAAEKEYATFLYVFLEDNPKLTEQFLSKNLYARAYRDFRSGRYAKAKEGFLRLIKDGSYKPQSFYLLARMSQLDQKRTQHPDFSEAREYLDDAIKADNRYEAPYYLRALVKIASSETDSGLKDLRKATELGITSCVDVNDQEEIEQVWASVASDARFQAIQTDCKRRLKQ